MRYKASESMRRAAQAACGRAMVVSATQSARAYLCDHDPKTLNGCEQNATHESVLPGGLGTSCEKTGPGDRASGGELDGREFWSVEARGRAARKRGRIGHHLVQRARLRSLRPT